MSHTLQTAIAFPVAFGSIALLLTVGPILYSSTNCSARIHYDYLEKQTSNVMIYINDQISYDDRTVNVALTSPERMHHLVRAVSDTITLIGEGVDLFEKDSSK
jgi:hypothetical protein